MACHFSLVSYIRPTGQRESSGRQILFRILHCPWPWLQTSRTADGNRRDFAEKSSSAQDTRSTQPKNIHLNGPCQGLAPRRCNPAQRSAPLPLTVFRLPPRQHMGHGVSTSPTCLSGHEFPKETIDTASKDPVKFRHLSLSGTTIRGRTSAIDGGVGGFRCQMR